VRRSLLVALLVAAPTARADVLELPALGARAVARAGAAMLADDGGVALLLDPASLARRGAPRVTAGVTVARHGARFTSDAGFSGGVPTVENRAPVTALPWGGAALGIGDRIVAGAVVLPSAHSHHRYPAAPPDFDPARDDRAIFPQRYAGERLRLLRWTAGAGVAVRALPWLAVGAAALVHWTRIDHQRVLWAGPPESAGLDLAELSPAYDMRFSASGSALVPGATVGAVIAPLDWPVEIGLAASFGAAARIAATPRLSDSRGATAGVREVAAVVGPEATAALELPASIVARAGARLVLGRVAVEVDGELAIASGEPAWELAGVAVAAAGQPAIELPRVPLGAVLEDALTVRAAADVEVVPGAVAAIAGYGFATRRLAAGAQSAVWPDGATHLLALGVEARVAGATVTLGVLHAVRPSRVAADSRIRVLDPRGPLVVRAATGETSSRATLVALDLELAFGGP
jgi:hypothetical protein